MFDTLESPTFQTRFRVLVAEDSQEQRQAIQRAVNRLRPDWEVITSANDCDQILRALDEEAPRLLILDAKATEGASTVDLIGNLPYPVPAIVVADKPDFAARAFDHAAVDYLLKPLSLARLERAFLRVGERASQRSDRSSHDTSHLNWLIAKKGDETIVIPTGEIYYLQSQLKYTRVIWSGGEALIKRGLGALEDLLDRRTFHRIHRSTVVNMQYVSVLRRDEMARLRVFLRGRPESLIVSQAHESLFKLPSD